MNRLTILRLAAIASFGFSITLITNILNPGLIGHKIFTLAAPNTYNTLLGFATFAGSFLSIFILPLIGILSDRTNTKYGQRLPFFLIGSIILSANLFLIAFAASVPALILGVVLYYLTNDIVFGPWMALYPDLVPRQQRGEAAGVRALLDIVALILGRQISAQLIGRVDLLGQSALTISVSIPILFLVISLFLTWKISKEIGLPSPKTDHPPLLLELKSMYRVDLKTFPAFRWWFINRILYWSAFNILGTFLLFYIIDVLGLSEPEAQRYMGTLAIVIGVAILFIAIPSGRIADRIGRKPLLVWAGALAVIGVIYILIVRDTNLLMIGGLFIGVSAGIYISASFALITDIVPADQAARYLGVAGIASAGGSAFARLLGGLIVDPLNSALGSSSIGYITLFSIAALLYLTSIFAGLKLPSNSPYVSSKKN